VYCSPYTFPELFLFKHAAHTPKKKCRMSHMKENHFSYELTMSHIYVLQCQHRGSAIPCRARRAKTKQNASCFWMVHVNESRHTYMYLSADDTEPELFLFEHAAHKKYRLDNSISLASIKQLVKAFANKTLKAHFKTAPVLAGWVMCVCVLCIGFV